MLVKRGGGFERHVGFTRFANGQSHDEHTQIHIFQPIGVCTKDILYKFQLDKSLLMIHISKNYSICLLKASFPFHFEPFAFAYAYYPSRPEEVIAHTHTHTTSSRTLAHTRLACSYTTDDMRQSCVLSIFVRAKTSRRRRLCPLIVHERPVLAGRGCLELTGEPDPVTRGLPGWFSADFFFNQMFDGG